MTDDYTRVEPLAGEATTGPTRTSALHPPYASDLDSQGTPGSDTGAKEKVKSVAASAGDAAGSVLDEARSGATDVKQEAQRQVRDLWGQARSELSAQGGAQQRRLAAALRSFGGELDQMAAAPEEPGAASDLARDLSRRAGEVGQWLENHSPEDLVDEVRAFARRRPGAFLLAAAGTGLLVGRLTRALKDGPSDAAPNASRPAGVGAAPVHSEQPTPPVSSYESTATASTPTVSSFGSAPTASTSTGGGL